MSVALGSLMSLTSMSDLRYEGTLHDFDSVNKTVSLVNVRSFGTEGRGSALGRPEVAAQSIVYPLIVFRGAEIKDLQIKGPPSLPEDPAIASVSSAPAPAPAPVVVAAAATVVPTPVPAVAPAAAAAAAAAVPALIPGLPTAALGPAQVPAAAPTYVAVTQQEYQHHQHQPRSYQSHGQGDSSSYHSRRGGSSNRGGYRDRQQQPRQQGDGNNYYSRGQHGQQQQQQQQHHRDRDHHGSSNQQQQSRQPRVDPNWSVPKDEFDFEAANARLEPTGDTEAANDGVETYNKASSFFDSLSTKSTDKNSVSGRELRQQERQTNMETFGQATSGYKSHRGGRGGNRGGGGGGGNRSHSHQQGNSNAGGKYYYSRDQPAAPAASS